MSEPIPVLRWACTCGRFVAESAITERTYRDPGAHYGVSTDAGYACTRCGPKDGLPRLVEIGQVAS